VHTPDTPVSRGRGQGPLGEQPLAAGTTPAESCPSRYFGAPRPPARQMGSPRRDRLFGHREPAAAQRWTCAEPLHVNNGHARCPDAIADSTRRNVSRDAAPVSSACVAADHGVRLAWLPAARLFTERPWPRPRYRCPLGGVALSDPLMVNFPKHRIAGLVVFRYRRCLSVIFGWLLSPVGSIWAPSLGHAS